MKSKGFSFKRSPKELFRNYHLDNEKYRQSLIEESKNLPETLFDQIDHWAKVKPDEDSMVEYHTGEHISWKKFSVSSKAFAARLSEHGIKKGDIVATSLPFLKEHMFLWFGLMRLGAIMAPLDMRLKSSEISNLFNKIQPKMYFFMGLTPVKDFREDVKQVMKAHHVKNGGSVKLWIQFQSEKSGVIKDAVHIKDFAKNIAFSYIWSLVKGFCGCGKKEFIETTDPCVIIFTTGSTGFPKAALLSHRGILVQSLGLKFAFLNGPFMEYNLKKLVILVNLPPSHVGGLTEQFGSFLVSGGKAILIPVFKPDMSLKAIEKYKVNFVGQIPALFNMEWKLKDYEKYDLSSLRVGIYGGQAVTKSFLEKMENMVGHACSGLGLTETSGFCSYTPIGGSVDDVMRSLGWDSPLCKISVRDKMNSDGSAGKELPEGEVGEICYSGEQIFLGYYGEPDKTKESLSTDGFLYTGDIGSYTKKEGLKFSSRRKFIIKPKGFQVFPHQVEDYISSQFTKQINKVAVVGVEHKVFSEGIVAVLELKNGEKLTADEVMKACEKIASYKRPSLVIFLDREMPLNRVAKTDYLEVKEIAKKAVEKEIENGGWDNL